MWHPSWGVPEFNRSKRPTTENVDWGAAAQQWLKNKEMYEQWQQQQYQQHMQMMTASQTMQQPAIDPSIAVNPPPPPPLPPPDASTSNSNNTPSSTLTTNTSNCNNNNNNNQVGDSNIKGKSQYL